MLISVDASETRPIYIQIIDEVRRAIVLGSLRADEALPSVRQLAVQLRVNPNTVSQAYRELERQGVVEVRRGQGTFVTGAKLNGNERRALARAVATRALRDAHRNGVSERDLIDAIHAAAKRAPHHHSSEESS